MTALKVRRLSAGYGPLAVVHDLDLDVATGEIVALLGRNGAGKTTTLTAIAGFVPKVTGLIEVGGRELSGRAYVRSRERLGIVLEGRSVFGSLSVQQNLTLADVKVADALDLFPELENRLKVPAGALSGGEQQMLSLARALCRRPAVLLVDELSFGLAPVVCQRMFRRLREAATATGMAILLVEQHLASAALVADRAVVMNEGRIALELPGSELTDRAGEVEQIYLGSVIDAGEPDRDRLTTAALGDTNHN